MSNNTISEGTIRAVRVDLKEPDYPIAIMLFSGEELQLSENAAAKLGEGLVLAVEHLHDMKKSKASRSN